jgi:6-phosphogluconolactonase
LKRKFLAILSIAVIVLAVFAAESVVNAVPKYVGFGYAAAVYTMDNGASGNNVLYYSRAADGSLTFVSSFSTNGMGTGTALASQGALALTNYGRFLLVVNAGSNDISVFKVQSGGGLTYLSKTNSEGTMPISLTVYNNLVYVLNAGGTPNIAGFWLSYSGTLTFITGSNQPLSGLASPSPEQIGFNTDGNVLVVTEKGTNMIDTYLIDSNGVASAPATLPSVGMGPYGFAFTGDNLIVTEAAGSAGTASLTGGSGTVSSYVLSDWGTLRTISGAMPCFGNAPCWIAINSAGTFAYTSDAHGGTISTFAISGAGSLTLVSSIETTTKVPCLDLAFSNHSQFLYALNGGYITGFQVYPDGSLWQVTSVNTGFAASATGLAAT